LIPTATTSKLSSTDLEPFPPMLSERVLTRTDGECSHCSHGIRRRRRQAARSFARALGRPHRRTAILRRSLEMCSDKVRAHRR
jgi:hypothetical protein